VGKSSTPVPPPLRRPCGEAPFRAYEAIFDASPDGIVVVDGRGRITAVNPQALRMLGYASGRTPGAARGDHGPPDVRGRHVALRDGFMERPRADPWAPTWT
jgi:PAS domain-containing protein